MFYNFYSIMPLFQRSKLQKQRREKEKREEVFVGKVRRCFKKEASKEIVQNNILSSAKNDEEWVA